MRVVVVGSGGRLGAAVVRELQRDAKFRVVAYDRVAMDLENPAKIEDHLRPLAFDALVNCAAMTSVDACENFPEKAHRINTAAPGQMAEICRAKNARILHFSTDYVYDGAAPGLRDEDSPIRPLGQYAATKWEGEQAVLRENENSCLLRTSWVFGPDRPSFPDQILAQAAKENRVEAICDKFSSPTYSLDAAQWLRALLEKPEVRGVINFCNSGACSWQEYGQATLDFAVACGAILQTREVAPLRLAEMRAFRAPRPIATAMNVAKLESVLGIKIRPWREALREYICQFHGTVRS